MITKNPMQLKAFIKNKAAEKHISAQLVMQNYMLERLLERISLSPYKNNFILKGGFLISAIVGLDTRATMDLDTTIKGFTLTHEAICKGITWSHTTSSIYGARFLPSGFLFNVEAPTLFPNDEKKLFSLLGFMNSCVAQKYLNAINATIHYLVGNIMALPIALTNNQRVDNLVDENIDISKRDWESFETSWDFQQSPLL